MNLDAAKIDDSNEEGEGLHASPSHEAQGTLPEQDAPLFDAYSQAVVRAAESVGPSVVRIEVSKKRQTQRGPRDGGGSGSGVILSPQCLFLTNSPVVHRPTRIPVLPSDVRRADALALGAKPESALA